MSVQQAHLQCQHIHARRGNHYIWILWTLYCGLIYLVITTITQTGVLLFSYIYCLKIVFKAFRSVIYYHNLWTLFQYNNFTMYTGSDDDIVNKNQKPSFDIFDNLYHAQVTRCIMYHISYVSWTSEHVYRDTYISQLKTNNLQIVALKTWLLVCTCKD